MRGTTPCLAEASPEARTGKTHVGIRGRRIQKENIQSPQKKEKSRIAASNGSVAGIVRDSVIKGSSIRKVAMLSSCLIELCETWPIGAVAYQLWLSIER